jgi:peptidoglycan L-alanyl-D-glutamate endopeptidase CwlK
MIDQVTLQRINMLHPKIKDEVLDIYTNKVCPALTGGVYCRFAYTLRTFAEQDALYAIGRTKLFDANQKRLGVVTNAKAGQSLHNYGLAFDIVLIDGPEASWDIVKDFTGDGQSTWMKVINTYKDNGYEWGGDWVSLKDTPHIQKVFGYTWQELLAKYQANDFIPGTTYLNL